MANFFAQFLANPRKVGSPFSCSKEVGFQMASAGNLEDAHVVVEFGPGKGPITGEILKQLQADATFFAIELDPKLAEATRKRHPGTQVYVDSCEHVAKYLKKHGHTQCDTIICTIPWALMDEATANRCLDAVEAALKPGGVFVTVGLAMGKKSKGGKRLSAQLNKRFTTVEMSKNIRNIPPAFYYRCVKSTEN